MDWKIGVIWIKQVVGGYLEVLSSRVDRQPKLQATALTPMAPQSIDYSIENYGWGAAENATLRVRMVKPDEGLQGRWQNLNLGTLEGIGSFSFMSLLQAEGVSPLTAAELADYCNGREPDDCLVDLSRDRRIGNIGPFLTTGQEGFLQRNKYGIYVDGSLRYDWRDDDGNLQSNDAPFYGFIPLGRFRSGAECEGGMDQQILGGRPFELRDSGDNYRIPFPISASVFPGEHARWEIKLEGTKSGQHLLRIVLQLADGQEVPSREVFIQTFQPKTFPGTIRPFAPRC